MSVFCKELSNNLKEYLERRKTKRDYMNKLNNNPQFIEQKNLYWSQKIQEIRVILIVGCIITTAANINLFQIVDDFVGYSVLSFKLLWMVVIAYLVALTFKNDKNAQYLSTAITLFIARMTFVYLDLENKR